MRARRSGFTLIEMLVVIAIIAVLAAILFPVFSRARASARKARCLSNLNQIGTAMKAYAADYGGYMVNWCVTHPAVAATAGWPAPPGDAIKNDPQAGVVTWDVSIMRYLKTDKVLVCTDNRNPRTEVGSRARAYAITRYTQKVVSGGVWGASLGRLEGDIPKPAETVMLFEKGNNLPGSWGDACGENVYESHNGPLNVNYDGSSESMTNTFGDAVNVRMFHNNGKNLLFVDGHAKWQAVGQGPFGQTGGSYAVKGMTWTDADLPR